VADEYGKIEKDAAIADAQEMDRFDTQASPVSSLDPDTRSES
jgi:hypothetical protein